MLRDIDGGTDMRHLYLWFVVAFAVTVFGFWPTTVGSFGPPDAIRITHGVFAVGWMLLLIAQSWLIGRRYRTLHRWLGWSSLIMVPGLVITALIVLRDALRLDTPFGVPLLLTVVWVDLWSLTLLVLLYVAALYYRRRVFLHSRLMASTVFVALLPALGRAYGMNIPALGGLGGALHLSFWTVEIVLIGLIARDGRHGRWRTPWWITLIALLAIEWTMFSAPSLPLYTKLVWSAAP
ncbi:hypothetical protein BH09PSE4_BH09PSE4_20620 [soil metagenome]